jgi:uncharacterized OB-fold protein
MSEQEGVGIFRCTTCGAKLFPERLLCPHCHGHTFENVRVSEGVIEDISMIRHMIGQENWQPRRIANVRTLGGPRITVGLRGDSAEGATIALFQEGNAPFGKAKAR